MPLVACGDALAAWTDPLDITDPRGYTIYISDIAAGRHGDVAAVGETYSKPDGVVVYSSEDRGPFEGEEVNDSGAESPAICLDRRDATLVLSHKVDFGGAVRVYTRPAGGRFEPQQILDMRPGYPQGIATSPAGEVMAYWIGTNLGGTVGGSLRVAVRSAAGHDFGPVQDVSARGGEVDYPRLLFDRRGNALLAWLADGRLEYSVRHPGGTFGPVRVLEPDVHYGEFDVAANRAGRAVAVWRAHPGKHNALRASVGSVAGGFGAVRRFGGKANRGPYVAVDRGGEAAVTWLSGKYPEYALRSALKPAGSGRFGTSHALARSYTDEFEVAGDGRGTLTIAWLKRGTVRVARHRSGKRGFAKQAVAANPTRGMTMATTAGGRTVIVSRTYKKHFEALVARPGRPFGRVTEVGHVRKGETLDGPGIVTGGDGGAFVWWGVGARNSDEGATWFRGAYLLP
jgi:hypothetical protein